MRVWAQSRLSQRVRGPVVFLSLFFAGAILILSTSQPANALPAFARKYGLRCSACHEAWPMLNYFGQKFKDNGYQLMNDRDSPIWQNPSYWPATFRMTSFWHRESSDKVAVDSVPGDPTSPTVEHKITTHGFDLSGLDFHTGGTLEKNVSFYLLPSSDNTGAFHFEQVFARLDNLLGSPWLNVKLGKFELDNLVSEKRILTLTNISGTYQTYHFSAPGDANIFGGIGDNQLGLEWLGHSADDRTRISAALLSSNAGNVGIPYGNSYTGFFAASHAFDVGKLGVDRIGAYAMLGEAPTGYLTSGGAPIAGSGFANKSFHREGLVGLLYFGKLDFLAVTQHGSDNAWFGQGYGDFIDTFASGGTCNSNAGPVPCNNVPGTALAPGSRSAIWNGYMVETHYVYNPQLIFIQRSEWERMQQQSTPGTRTDLGNIDMYTFGYRWYPIMNPRAGFAIHNEYSWIRQKGTAPVSATDLTNSSLMLGFDFDF